MESLRNAQAINPPVLQHTGPPFSNFDFVDNYFESKCVSLKRILSQMRVSSFQSMVIEEIKSVGISKDDDDELLSAGVQLFGKPLVRISFFKTKLNDIGQIEQENDENYLGYAILKYSPSIFGGRWIVFESITKPGRHDNNYYHCARDYSVRVCGKTFHIKGNIYCQQNTLTNVCAHVALRTCISAVHPDGDISYRAINEILEKAGKPHSLKDGLTDKQIRAVLDGLGINYYCLWYPADIKNRPPVPYQKLLYGSIESGCPALLAFSSVGGASGHIIPVIGHTFNEDTWVPNADMSYFAIGKDTRYVPSESWVSTYVCHDDNFGSHFCLPRGYLQEGAELFAVGILPKEAKYDAIRAEAIAVDFLYNIAICLPLDPSPWIKRFKDAITLDRGWIVLRPIFMAAEKYVSHLEQLTGWEGEKIDPKVIATLKTQLHGFFWVVEVSLPEIFPANRRKIGEVVLNANMELVPKRDFSTLVLARLLDQLYLLTQDEKKQTVLAKYPTGTQTHTGLFQQ